MPNSVDATPTKRFFVSMLTRDIELKDAIMDLLDNCVDGVLRQLPKQHEHALPYDGYWAKITAAPDGFSISDNCGGIPRDIALESAFRLGRLDTDRDKDIATVGMYGIGMKRALFKMGRYSQITSRHEDQSYYVEITPDWLDDDKDWSLNLIDAENQLDFDGTLIRVSNLYDSIKTQFDPSLASFLGELYGEISSFYALIIKKGFKVYLNDEEIRPVNLDILMPRDFSQDSISPYAYKGQFNGVDIELFVGFYSRLASEHEIEDEETRIARSKDNAGWTVICNDRVVLHRDKSRVTGWGVYNVPNYHNQFIAIAGVVRFYSNEPLKLPLNTTKRGLETSSDIYWHTLSIMCEGLKKFTDFTNHWKGREQETNSRFESSVLKDATEVVRSIPEKSWSPMRGTSGLKFSPELPRPPREDLRRRITFLRPVEEVELVGQYLFENPKADPTEIGGRCFDEVVKRAKEEEL